MPPALFDFAWIPALDAKLQDLADMAQAENWSYRHQPDPSPNPILFNFFTQTYDRLNSQGKIAVTADEEWCCFNSGLVTPNQEEIFALFQKHRVPGRQPWFHKGFFQESARDLTVFGELPQIATYFDDPADLLYDYRLRMRPRYDHIIDDNHQRFPDPYNDITDANIKHQLRNILEGSIAHSVRRIKRNYKTAIPQFYKNRVQLLIPLCITSVSRADVALVVEKSENSYTASTCLPLDWAYNNARLIARPDNDWLQP